MLDLDLLNKSIEIKLKGEVLKVNQPSFSLAKKVRAFERNVGSMEEEEIYNEQSNIILSFINNNTNSKKMSQSDLEELSFNSIKALYTELVNAIIGIETNPN